MQSIDFVNKVYAGGTKRTAKDKLSILAVIIFAVVLVGGIAVAGGVGGVSVSVLALLMYNLSNISKTKNDRYIMASARFEPDEGAVTLKHFGIDYDDKKGARDEILQMRWADVASIDFNEELGTICIKGAGNKEIQWKSEKRPAQNKTISQIMLYVPTEKTEEFLNLIKPYGYVGGVKSEWA
jgi:hypothetical protein